MQAERRNTQSSMLHHCRRQAGPHPAEVSEASDLPKLMNLALKSPVSRLFDSAEKVQPWILRGL